MKPLLFGAIVGALLCTPVVAQQASGNANNPFGAQNGNQNSAVLQLPSGVKNVVSIDALNTIIIASDGELPGQTRYTPTRIQHVYSGGIARLFGGFSVPTAQFVSPSAMNNSGFGDNNNGGVATVGGGNQNDGFGGAQNGAGGGFQNNASGFGGGFQNGALNGSGFGALAHNAIINARVRAR